MTTEITLKLNNPEASLHVLAEAAIEFDNDQHPRSVAVVNELRDQIRAQVPEKPTRPAYGEPARAHCGAPGRSTGGTSPLVLFVSAQDNDLFLDAWDPSGARPAESLPMPSNDALAGAAAAVEHLRYHKPADFEQLVGEFAEYITSSDARDWSEATAAKCVREFADRLLARGGA